MSINAEQLFIALDTFDQLQDPSPEQPKRVSFNELFQYATNPNHSPSPQLSEALGRDLSLRRDLKRLLAKDTILTMARSAAASSGDILERETNGFTIRLKPSKAHEDQIYLLITTDTRDEVPRLLFVEEENGAIWRLPIDDFEDGHFQSVLESSAPIVKALKNHASLVMLRS